MRRERTREEFEAAQREALDREWYDLITDETGEREAFVDLAIATWDECGSEVAWHPFRAYVESAFCALSDRRIMRAMKPRLRSRWKAWARTYRSLEARNPRLELANKLQDVSESWEASSWPTNREHRIERWAKGAAVTDDDRMEDRHGVLTPAFVARLGELRERAGGWLFWDDAVRRVRFMPTAEAERIGREREKRVARIRERRERGDAQRARKDAELARIERLARADGEFWETMLAAERAHAEGSVERTPTPRTVIPPVSPRLKSDLDPDDGSTAEFFAALLRHGDEAWTEPHHVPFLNGLGDRAPGDATAIITHLRRAACRDLGLSGPIRSADGSVQDVRGSERVKKRTQ